MVSLEYWGWELGGGGPLVQRVRRNALFDLLQSGMLRLFFPLVEEANWVALGVIIYQLGAVLTEPDTIVGMSALLGCEAWIVAGPAQGGGSDVGCHADVDCFDGIGTRATGGLAAVGVGAAVASPIRESIYCCFRKVVSIRSTHGGVLLNEHRNNPLSLVNVCGFESF